MKKKKEIDIRSSASEYLTYVSGIGESINSIEIRYEDENIWLTQKMMAVLYGVTISAINQHIKKIYEDSELEPDSTIKKYLTVQNEGSRNVSRNNYLKEKEIKQLERLVSSYLDYAEMQAGRGIPMTMQDWEKRLNGFLTFMDYEVLQDAGKISAEIAKQHAETEFEKYRIIQDKTYISDFDRFLQLEQQIRNKGGEDE